MNMPEASWPVEAPPSVDYFDEEERASILAGYGLDSLDDDVELKAIVQFAGDLCAAPIALVSLVEEKRQRFLARRGIDARETPRDVSFCAHAMRQDAAMEVPDALEDPRFAENPLVTGEPHIRFYAGHPLVSPEGIPLGSLCVIDRQPRPSGLTPLQRQGLSVLAGAVMLRLGARREGLAARFELERSEARFRALADSIPDIAWSAGPEGKPDYFNRRWFEFTGMPAGDLSRAGADFIHPDDYGPMREAWAKSIDKGEPFEFENRLQRHDGEYLWVLSRAVPVRDDEGKVTQWFGTVTDIDETRRLSESRDLLARELSHRIKNIFAVIGGLVTLLARARPEHQPFAEQLTQTIRALGRAHEHVRPSGRPKEDNLRGLLEVIFTPYGSGEGGRVNVKGGDFPVGSKVATPLALVFHELATNSAKYGALAASGGRVDIEIADQGETLLLTWTERGGKAPKKPGSEGFGTRLIDMSVSNQLGGTWERRFERDGLVVVLSLSRKALSG